MPLRELLLTSISVLILLLGAPALSQTQPPALAAQPAATELVQGRLGLGASTSNAPLGLRMWFGSAGFDVGLGLVVNGKEPVVDGDDTQTTADWAVDLGGLLALYTGDHSLAFLRLGLNIDRRYAVGSDEDGPIDSRVLTIGFGPQLGMELFMTWLGFPELSFQGSVGLNYAWTSGAEAGGESTTDWAFGSVNNGLGILGNLQVGFHYYFDL